MCCLMLTTACRSGSSASASDELQKRSQAHRIAPATSASKFLGKVAGDRYDRERDCSSPWYAARRRELENRPLILAQAFGEAVNPDRLVGLVRYEVHLDRKFERRVAVLLKLQELRRTADPS